MDYDDDMDYAYDSYGGGGSYGGDDDNIEEMIE
jgi:hypothetical protein